jgi:NAD(P)-dependent dehydrogenase (short-subunit alcohol dehydrogenase family)
MTDTQNLLGYAGRTAVVAGGGGTGMGAAVVELLVGLGAKVTVLDLRASEVDGSRFRRTDLGDPEDIARAVDDLDGQVDALFHCQGISGAGAGISARTVMAVNFLGVRQLTELLLPRMPGGSAIASISSAGGLGWQKRSAEILDLLDTPDMAAGLEWCDGQTEGVLRRAFPHAYAFSKQALILWTMQRSATTITQGVRLNVTSPGSTLTAMAADFPDEGVELMNHPSGRTSSPPEQAWPLVYLNSAVASYVNGVNVPVDGGNHAARTVSGLAAS